MVILAGSLFSFAAFAQNQPINNNYTVLAPLPGTLVGPAQGGGWQTDLQTYLPGLFNLLIGLSAVFAVLMIVIGGFQYMSTDAIMKKESGKKRIMNAVYGLVLVIGAWLILSTINPNLLNINLNIQSAPTSAPTGTSGGQLVSGNQITATCPGCVINPSVPINLTPVNMAKLSCNSCVPMDSILPINGNMQANATPSMNASLVQLYAASIGSGFKVTEGYPPVVNHLSSCHYNATCVDVTITSQNASDISTFISTANTQGFKTYYEVADVTRQQALISGGVPAANILVTGNTEHFHLVQ